MEGVRGIWMMGQKRGGDRKEGRQGKGKVKGKERGFTRGGAQVGPQFWYFGGKGRRRKEGRNERKKEGTLPPYSTVFPPPSERKKQCTALLVQYFSSQLKIRSMSTPLQELDLAHFSFPISKRLSKTTSLIKGKSKAKQKISHGEIVLTCESPRITSTTDNSTTSPLLTDITSRTSSKSKKRTRTTPSTSLPSLPFKPSNSSSTPSSIPPSQLPDSLPAELDLILSNFLAFNTLSSFLCLQGQGAICTFNTLSPSIQSITYRWVALATFLTFLSALSSKRDLIWICLPTFWSFRSFLYLQC